MHHQRRLLTAILMAGLSTNAWSYLDIDNLLDQRSSTTGKRSALFTYDKKAYSDRHLANTLGSIMYKRGEYNIDSAAFMFQTCYGGGMIDEIRDGYGNVNIALGSASRHDQVAWAGAYSSFWTSAVRPELTSNQYVDAFFTAYSTDPVGPVAGPRPPDKDKKSGLPITEEPQWTWTRDGNQMRLNSAQRYYAILWAGQGDLVADLGDINGMYNRLREEWTFFNKPFSIVVLYGDGKQAADGSLLPGHWNARAATAQNLNEALWEAADRVNTDTQFVFYATGHGSRLTELIKTSTVVPKDTPGGVVEIRIDKGELDGMVLNLDNQPLLEFEYAINGSDPIQVFLDGQPIGQLPSGQTFFALPVSEALLTSGKGVGDGGAGVVPGIGEVVGESGPVAVSPPSSNGAATDGSARFALSFAIASSSEATLHSAVFHTGGIAALAPVPEPASWAMLLAGLSLLGFWTRRQAGSGRAHVHPGAYGRTARPGRPPRS